ncbi:MAG TPA: hypothetical protein VIH85_06960 [Solirubrobacteraceae bacterium]
MGGALSRSALKHLPTRRLRISPVPGALPIRMFMNGISSVGAMSGIAAAQSMFGLAAQTASGVTDADGGSGSGGAAEAVQVALLQKTLDMERSMVNILA